MWSVLSMSHNNFYFSSKFMRKDDKHFLTEFLLQTYYWFLKVVFLVVFTVLLVDIVTPRSERTADGANTHGNSFGREK
jgi:hypothetical protein